MNHKQGRAPAGRKSEKPRTPKELELALKKDIALEILQTCTAHRLFHERIVPVLKRQGLHNDVLILNNASLKSQLLFLRKLNEFFEHLPKEKPLKEDDLRAEHYSDYESPGPFLSDEYESQLTSESATLR